jgi:ubiquinone/menaquinone biosynthesis C-methylase UbiE
MKHLQLSQNEKILDAGCGIGYYGLGIAKKGGNTIGVDISKESIQNAVERAKGVKSAKFVIGNILALPFKRGAFNKIICVDVLEHIEDDSTAVSELCRVLKKGGILIIHVPRKDPGTYILRNLDQKVFGHVRTGYTLEILKNMMVSKGMKIIEYEYTFKMFGMLAWELGYLYPRMSKYLFPFLFAFSSLDVFSRKRGNGILLVCKKV